jgi:hypothetical protein
MRGFMGARLDGGWLAVGTDWQRDLEHWLERFLQGLGQQDAAPDVPADAAGLIGPDDRKSIHPRAARIDAVTYDSLRPPPPSPRRRMATARFAFCASAAVQAQFCP